MPSRQQQAAEPPQQAAEQALWRGQWGLQFQSANGDVLALENSFRESRAASHQATATVLSAGASVAGGAGGEGGAQPSPAAALAGSTPSGGVRPAGSGCAQCAGSAHRVPRLLPDVSTCTLHLLSTPCCVLCRRGAGAWSTGLQAVLAGPDQAGE